MSPVDMPSTLGIWRYINIPKLLWSEQSTAVSLGMAQCVCPPRPLVGSQVNVIMYCAATSQF